MRLMKILGLALVAVVAVTAFTGSANAARLHPLIAFCKTQELLLCAAANQVKSDGTLLLSQIGTGVIEGTINQKCTGGEIQAETGEMVDGVEPSTESKLLGKITKLTFTGCEPCKKVTTAPPFTANTKMKEEVENGKWTLEGALNFKLEECSFGVNCKFGATELNPTPFIEMTATEAILKTNKAELKREEGNEFLCGNVGKWNANFKLELKLSDNTVHNIWPTLLLASVIPHSLIKFCLKNELLLCTDSNTAELKGTLVFLQIGTSVREGTINQKCTGGKIEGKLKASPENMVEGPGAEENKLLGELTNLTFTGCEPCKKVTTNPPFRANLRHTPEKEEEAKIWLLESGFNLTFEECSFGVSCKFGATELSPAPFIEMTATEAILNTNKAELKREAGSEFFCGSTIKWNAKYALELELTTGSGVTEKIWPTLCKKEAVEKTCL